MVAGCIGASNPLMCAHITLLRWPTEKSPSYLVYTSNIQNQMLLCFFEPFIDMVWALQFFMMISACCDSCDPDPQWLLLCMSHTLQRPNMFSVQVVPCHVLDPQHLSVLLMLLSSVCLVHSQGMSTAQLYIVETSLLARPNEGHWFSQCRLLLTVSPSTVQRITGTLLTGCRAQGCQTLKRYQAMRQVLAVK